VRLILARSAFPSAGFPRAQALRAGFRFEVWGPTPQVSLRFGFPPFRLPSVSVSLRRFPSAGFPPQVSLRRFPSAGFPPQVSLRRFPSAGFPPQVSLRRFSSAGFLRRFPPQVSSAGFPPFRLPSREARFPPLRFPSREARFPPLRLPYAEGVLLLAACRTLRFDWTFA